MGAARSRQLRIVTVVATIGAVTGLVPLEAAAQNETLAYANVIDGVAAEPIADATVVVADELGVGRRGSHANRSDSCRNLRRC